MKAHIEKIIIRGHVRTALNVIDGKWKLEILYFLRQATLRFSELEDLMPEVKRKVLTAQLRELERDGLVSRQVYAEVPPRVEYSVTPLGRSLTPVLLMLCDWGKAYEEKRQHEA